MEGSSSPYPPTQLRDRFHLPKPDPKSHRQGQEPSWEHGTRHNKKYTTSQRLRTASPSFGQHPSMAGSSHTRLPLCAASSEHLPAHLHPSSKHRGPSSMMQRREDHPHPRLTVRFGSAGQREPRTVPYSTNHPPVPLGETTKTIQSLQPGLPAMRAALFLDGSAAGV